MNCPHDPPSTTPAPGDRVLGCVHRPDPFHQVHVFWMPEPMRFRRPNGTEDEAQWVMICGACFARHGSDALRAPIATDLVWPKGVPAITYRDRS
jgi:hypothetical protein